MPFLHCVSSFEVTNLAFTSTDTTFHNFFDFTQNYLNKKDFCHKFSFFNGLNQTPLLPLAPKNLLSVAKVFC